MSTSLEYGPTTVREAVSRHNDRIHTHLVRLLRLRGEAELVMRCVVDGYARWLGIKTGRSLLDVPDLRRRWQNTNEEFDEVTHAIIESTKELTRDIDGLSR